MTFPVLLENNCTDFPPFQGLDNEGLVAISRDVNPANVVAAYNRGIFPWYSEMDPVLWWSPNPRCIIRTDKVKVSKSMKSILRNNKFTFSINKEFKKVISACSEPRKEQQDTWILPEMIKTYFELHKKGTTHSVETYLDNKLVGGFYGLSIGKYFAGESMFSNVSNSSKAALIVFLQYCHRAGIPFVDCQVTNPHLISLGAEEINRNAFLKKLDEYKNLPLLSNLWEPKQIFYTP